MEVYHDRYSVCGVMKQGKVEVWRVFDSVNETELEQTYSTIELAMGMAQFFNLK